MTPSAKFDPAAKNGLFERLEEVLGVLNQALVTG
jgi:hypothetical protein